MSVVSVVVLAACGGESNRVPKASKPTPMTVVVDPEPAPRATVGPPPAPLPAGPGLVVVNPSEVDIHIYGAYLVDEKGLMGTRALWRHRFDCDDDEDVDHVVPRNGGRIKLPPPTQVFDDGCKPPQTLPPGRYLLRLDSGYTEDFYASASITVPLQDQVELTYLQHQDEPYRCNAAKARRAARIALAGAAELAWLPAGLFAGCDPTQARCQASPRGWAPPPPRCTMLLHEDQLRVRLPTTNDTPMGLLAWVDREAIYARRPDVDRTSAARANILGKSLVVAGRTSHHMHEHGGDAAAIGSIVLDVFNPHPHPIGVRVVGLEHMVDFSCAFPAKVVATPAVRSVSTKMVPPGLSTLEVDFEPQRAYQGHCERFATRATLDVSGTKMVVTSEHEVSRFDPID